MSMPGDGKENHLLDESESENILLNSSSRRICPFWTMIHLIVNVLPSQNIVNLTVSIRRGHNLFIFTGLTLILAHSLHRQTVSILRVPV